MKSFKSFFKKKFSKSESEKSEVDSSVNLNNSRASSHDSLANKLNEIGPVFDESQKLVQNGGGSIPSFSRLNSVEIYQQILEEHKDVLPKNFTLRQFPFSSLQSENTFDEPEMAKSTESSENNRTNKQELLSVSSSSLSPSPVSQISPNIDTASAQFSELSDSKDSPPMNNQSLLNEFRSIENESDKTEEQETEDKTLSNRSNENGVLDFDNNDCNKRFYHVFKKSELDSLINIHCPELMIYDSFYDHGNWCICARKVKSSNLS